MELWIAKGPLIMFGRLPNCIVDEYTAPGNPAVKLCGNEPGLPLHDFSFGCPCSWEPIYILRFHIEFIDQNNWANVFFFHLLGECYFLIHFNELCQDLTLQNMTFLYNKVGGA